MDDIKLYTSTKNQMNSLIKITETISTDIQMEFGLDKCKTNSIERGKWTNTNGTVTTTGKIEHMDEANSYKYLGFDQTIKLNHTELKQRLIQKFTSRLTQLLKSKLN